MGEVRISLETYKGRWRTKRRVVLRVEHPKHGAVTIDIHRRFVTDLDTIPRVPLIYDWLKDRAVASYVVHDWCYMKGLDRRVADDLLLMMLEIEGVAKRYRYPIYFGVRLFGQTRYKKRAGVIRV